jgi:hypothetical protein
VDPIIVTPPAVEPVSLAEARSHLLLPSTVTDQDAEIQELITSAREFAENFTGRTYVHTTYDWVLDHWPMPASLAQRALMQTLNMPSPPLAEIRPPRSPLVSVASITYYDPQGVQRTLDPAVYQVMTGTPGRIIPAFAQAWPAVRSWPGSITVRFVAGYSADASGVPKAVKSAIRLMVGGWFTNREHIARQRPRVLPSGVDWLLSVSDSGAYD